MHFHTGNVYYGAVPTVHLLIFLNKKQIQSMKKQHPQLGFTFITSLDICTAHGRITLKDNKICYMCKQEYLPDKSTKIYTRKELVMMETTISESHTSFYIPTIQKLAFNLPHVRILGTNHCGEM